MSICGRRFAVMPSERSRKANEQHGYTIEVDLVEQVAAASEHVVSETSSSIMYRSIMLLASRARLVLCDDLRPNPGFLNDMSSSFGHVLR